MKAEKNSLSANIGLPGCHSEGYLPYITDVTKSMEDYAEKYIKETPDKRTKCLKELRDILREEEPNLHYREGDEWLLKFLRARNFNVRRAAVMIKKYYTFLEQHREFFEKGCSPSNAKLVENFLKADLINILPYRDAKNRAIVCGRTRDWNPDDLPTEDAIFGGIVALKTTIDMPANQIMGYVGILDLKGFSFKQAFSLFPYTVFAYQGLQFCCPGKVQEIHVMNFPETFRVVWNVLKYLMSEKIRKRIVFHKKDGLDSLHKHIPKALLPELFGGDLGPVDNTHWTTRYDVQKLQEDYLKETSYGYKDFKKKSDKDKRFSALSTVGLTLLEGLKKVSGDNS